MRSKLILIGIYLGLANALSMTGWASTPVMRVVRGETPAPELLVNHDFEQLSAGRLPHWVAAPQGYDAAEGQGRNGSRAVRCSALTRGWYGASQTITLNQTNPSTLVVSGWSKAADVGGGADSDYSLYVDLQYADGTPLWGQTANFQTGTHDWQRRELVVLPEKPVKSLTLHCLFRNHSGQAWFDEVSVREVRAEHGAILFQGVPVVLSAPETTPSAAPATARTTRFATTDGLSLGLADDQVASIKISGKELRAKGPSGFLARDVAADSDVYGFENGSCPELGLQLHVQFTAQPDYIAVEGSVADTRGRDRAITLVFALPLDALGWRWGDDVRHSRVIRGEGEFSRMVSIKCGATGTMSLYPLAAVSGQQEGVALAIDMDRPAQYRLGYHAGAKQLFIAYDFSLVPETERFPRAADFRFVLYRFEPAWGFRAAFEKLTRIFPEYFRVRSKEQGLWMPFTDISRVQGWEDFGFRFHEGNNNVSWDDAHGVLSFRYTEPMTWWMRMPPAVPRSLNEAVRLRDGLAQSGQGSEHRMAQVSRVAAMWDESGQACLLFRNEPWCNGAVWSLNPNPYLPESEPADSSSSKNAPNAATVHWNQTIRQELYGPEAKGRLDGEYLDSLEGYVTADLNFRREHFRYSTVPLTFSQETKQPALFKGLAVFEFTRWFSGQVHQLGKLTFANGVPYRFAYLCPWLDVLGTETDWVRQGRYHPPPDEQMNLWRTMAGAKPYLLLMNTDYDLFTSAMVERYFQRSLFYGMFPGMFSHNAADNPYWQNPKWYNRDRALFKKYIPLVKQVAQAGWQPVTHATCDNPHMWLERFGPDSTGTQFFNVFNDTDAPQSGRLRIEPSMLPGNTPVMIQELVAGKLVGSSNNVKVDLGPQEVNVIAVSPAR